MKAIHLIWKVPLVLLFASPAAASVAAIFVLGWSEILRFVGVIG